ncbi:hexulose-6-phosphate isomerase [Enterococcus haemoperoxidus ATCC BAA-382]|uniref:L-ribulose-5-phosphate 3-epimerase n=1 Tax=Enterococcus haemoperoxidus ATCC BAA-382 TaxID=1158608 RepID=R2SBC4_9ENTE|nr:L-ribulose-5-phosphate 3-epimerase [Enterococcus haemoperoxidus]EOH92830.1 hexulose-6-phosphate isomerase [Enterococcus haemoperoxidus ATCC BAA-382]EOT61573.1 hexulose-6-phosphate isomerase [Enterococcus haemoperoxidus ATCC BAA-382]OJG55406.1 hexulose-6-phosphate isomerase [Enterococcus haemoperoxidus]
MTTIGIYEKALPKDIDWKERLLLAKKLEFDFVEMSIDETDERLQRLDWTKEERKEVREAIHETGVKILSICLSGHRRFPFGSEDRSKRIEAMNLMGKAIDLASDLGVRTIQLAGYDVYYEKKTLKSREYFIENLKKAVAMAAAKEIVLSIEIMDDPFINSISKFLKIKDQIRSPYLQVYPDVGNLSAWPENDVGYELEIGIDQISAIHLKDTLAVTEQFSGKFKEVPFGSGCVDFLGCLKTLKRLEYNGPFLIEMWSENSETPEKEIEQAKAFLFPYLKEAGYRDK